MLDSAPINQLLVTGGVLFFLQAAATNIHPSRRAPGALLIRMRSAHAASVDHYSFGLIAQDTLTVTDSVSSPCATGAAEAAMPPAILPR